MWAICEKKPVPSYALFLKYGGEGGIRTPDTLPYTHFPGVLLQPLGHLTILYCCLTAWGATGRYYRELREKGQAVFTLNILFGYTVSSSPDGRRRGCFLTLRIQRFVMLHHILRLAVTFN